MAWVPSIGQNLQPFTSNGDVSICIEWKILEWDVKTQTNKQTKQIKIYITPYVNAIDTPSRHKGWY